MELSTRRLHKRLFENRRRSEQCVSEPNDVVYQCQGDREFLVRIYQPDGPGPFPTVVDVHGGAWHIGDRRQNAVMHAAMAAAGILVAALDFRQSHDAPYPASILDINLGVRWVKANAHRFNGTLRVGGLGSSTGGHQILLTALRPYDERYTPLPLHDGPDVDASLAFVVACWPVSDPLVCYRRARELGLDGVDAHEAYWPSEAAMAEGNPQLILERGDAQQLPSLLVLQGTADELVPPQLQERFVQTYRSAGGEVELVVFEGMPHTFVQRQPEHPQSRRAIDTMIQYVREQSLLAAAVGSR
jgi:acetyl esterase